MLLCLDLYLTDWHQSVDGSLGPQNLCFNVTVSSVWNSLPSGFSLVHHLTHSVIYLKPFQAGLQSPLPALYLWSFLALWLTVLTIYRNFIYLLTYILIAWQRLALLLLPVHSCHVCRSPRSLWVCNVKMLSSLNYWIYTVQYNTIETFVARTMSVNWQNWRQGQSLVAHGRVKKRQRNKMF